MKPIVIRLNENGKVELTENELQKMLEDAYREGKQDTCWYIPWYNNQPGDNPATTPSGTWCSVTERIPIDKYGRLMN